jgi:RND family efflux transporter MFP subunit
MKRIISIIILIVILVASGFLLKKNHDTINQQKTSSGISAVVSVNVTEVKEMTSTHNLHLTGTLSPVTELNIAAQAQGQITSLNVELGQFKSKGSILATIDNRLKQLSLQSAKVSISKLKRDLDRYENLFKGGSVTEQQLDDARNAYENAKIQLEQAQKQLADATIIAPFSGIITQKQVEKGAYINIGNPIATMVDISKLKIKINVSESNVYQIKKNDPAIITSDIYPEKSFNGRISFISEKGDDTHSYQVEIEMPNNSKYPLKAGTFVNATVTIPGKQMSLYIPREALQGSSQDASVFVAENGKALLKKITLGTGTDLNLEVLSGLKKGDKVVTTGQINLENGKEIRIVETK